MSQVGAAEVVRSLAATLLAAAGPWPYRLLAAGLPLLVTAGLGVALTRPIPPCGRDCEVTELLDRQLEERDPQLVVVGNSMARRDLDLTQLAEGLGVDPDRAVLLALPGTSPGSWYALLRYRVFERGYRPSLVVVVGAPRSFWVTRPVIGADVSALVQIAGSEDPLVRRIHGETGPLGALWSRANLNRRIWRTSIVESVVRGARSLQAATGVPQTEDMEEVFGVAGGDPEGLRNILGGTARDGEVELADTVEQSFFPEILRMSIEHEAELVVAAVPPRNEVASAFGGTREEREDALAGWLTRSGATWLPMDDVVLPRRVYADNWHLVPEGAALYTSALVDAMREAREP